MKLTKQQIEALSDLYEVMDKHELSFSSTDEFGSTIVYINQHRKKIYYSGWAINSDCIKLILDENKGASDEVNR